MGFKQVIPQVVTRFINGEDPFTIFGAQQTRSFNFIDDAVQGTILAMNTPNVSSEIFHIGDEKAEISIESLVKFIGSQLNFNGQYIDGPIHQGSVHRRCPNTQKAKELLNYSPQVSWQDGVKITIDWYKQYLSSKGDIYE
jgi:UDP-glucose 4-epimerase